MRNHLLAVFALLATIALVSCGTPSTPEFIRTAVISDMYEVEAGKIAAEKGKSYAVKQFGQRMVEAHSQTTEELKGKVDLPTKLDAKHQLMIEDLLAAHPEDFDRTYAKQQVSAHERAENLFSKYADKGDDEVVKAFAAKVLAVIKQHLEEAKKLVQ
jgi:putative membrane protein